MLHTTKRLGSFHNWMYSSWDLDSISHSTDWEHSSTHSHSIKHREISQTCKHSSRSRLSMDSVCRLPSPKRAIGDSISTTGNRISKGVMGEVNDAKDNRISKGMMG